VSVRAIYSALSAVCFVAVIFPALATEDDCCWIDVKTGKQVPTAPISGVNIGGIHEHATPEQHSVAIVSDDRKTARNSYNGKNYARESDGCWIDIKTGKKVPSVPLSGVNIGGIHEHATPEQHSVAIVSDDRKTAHNSYNGKNYARVSCPSPAGAQQAPTPSTTDKVTDSLKTIGSSIGIGIGGGGSSEHRHHDRVRGEDRTKTAEKLSDHKTRTTKTPTSSGKTITSACKCHPCTCSPCKCH